MSMTKKQREENRKAWEERDKEKKKREKTMQLLRFMRGEKASLSEWKNKL